MIADPLALCALGFIATMMVALWIGFLLWYRRNND